ncbi:hypothetical protein ES692_01675 [Psychroserpens burtonensis]|uniref:Uncharacterized protein n=1 Tax=Psychroserpens burtonensis TaxID=49278 RepID=A0A5C7BBG8_9FLAO|nr:hypothetical protein [Psychroserpens burtonensis]TXE19994.1 hypothetical protein ES692_01675 [Psychroserpens burtonensis]
MKLLKVTCIVLVLFVFSCKDNTPQPNPAFASLDLKRGEILLCGTPQFGHVSFAIDCNSNRRELVEAKTYIKRAI